MATFPDFRRLLKGGLVLIDRDTSAVWRIITLQYNPDTLSRTLQMQGGGGVAPEGVVGFNGQTQI